MADIIFVRTRWHYDSYIDFWKLVELSGFPICYTDEVEIDKDVMYIVSPHNGEWKSHIDSQVWQRERKAKLCLLNLERPSGSNGTSNYISDNKRLIQEAYFDYVFVSDRALSALTGFPFMPIGGHASFGEIGSISDKKYDLITLSCYSLHRSWMFISPIELRPLLYNMTVATNASAGNPARHSLLMESKAMLNIHQDGQPYCEPLRMIVAVMYGLPIFSEECNTFPFGAHKFNIGGFSGYAPTMSRLLHHEYEVLREDAKSKRELFISDNSFYNCIMRTV